MHAFARKSLDFAMVRAATTAREQRGVWQRPRAHATPECVQEDGCAASCIASAMLSRRNVRPTHAGTTMALKSFDPFQRSAILVCDNCDHVLMADGSRSSRSHEQLDPDELNPHYDSAFELRVRARDAGWREHDDGTNQWRWECPACHVARCTPQSGAA